MRGWADQEECRATMEIIQGCHVAKQNCLISYVDESHVTIEVRSYGILYEYPVQVSLPADCERKIVTCYEIGIISKDRAKLILTEKQFSPIIKAYEVGEMISGLVPREITASRIKYTPYQCNMLNKIIKKKSMKDNRCIYNSSSSRIRNLRDIFQEN